MMAVACSIRSCMPRDGNGMDGGSAEDGSASDKLDHIHFCLNEGCTGRLEEVNGNHDDLKVEFACSEGCRDAKCLTELAWN